MTANTKTIEQRRITFGDLSATVRLPVGMVHRQKGPSDDRRHPDRL